MHSQSSPQSRLALTADIVTAYLGKNPVSQAALPNLIRLVYDALGGEVPKTVKPVPPAEPKPAATVQPIPKRTIYPDYIICLEDGRKLKTLKRHLRAAYDLSPEQYREKWGLPQDYPMTAPNYAAKRSTLARTLGLGRKGTGNDDEAEPEPAAADLTADWAEEAAEMRKTGAKTGDLFLRLMPSLDLPPPEPDADAVFARFPSAEPEREAPHADKRVDAHAEAAPVAAPPAAPKRVPFSQQRIRAMRTR